MILEKVSKYLTEAKMKALDLIIEQNEISSTLKSKV